MKMASSPFRRWLLSFTALAATAVVASAAPKPAAPAATPTPGVSLLSNGDFEKSTDGQKPVDWVLKDNTTWEKEGENHFMRLKSPAPDANVTVYRAVPIKAGHEALELSFRARYEDIKKGKKNYFDARIMLNWKDAAMKGVNPSPSHPAFAGSSKGEWVQKVQQFKVPEGATTLEMIITIFNAESGQIDLDDFKLVSVPAAPLVAAEEAKKAAEAARIAALPPPKPQVPVPPASALPKPLKVIGNKLQNSEGKDVWLQGLALPSMEWSAGGENILRSIEKGTSEWKANCIRLCLGSKFYEGKGPYQNDGGAKYRQLVEDAVNLCASKGVYIVLDLHEYRAPEQRHADFWKAVATKFKDHPAVIFELLNEPHDIPWAAWQKGGETGTERLKSDVAVENNNQLKTFKTIGMQALVDTIRATGARNVIVAGGLDWSYDLSGVLQGYALSDPQGNGIMYSTHVYPWKSDWQNKFITVAEKYPIFMGEVGADEKKMTFISAEAQEDPHTWVPDILGIVQKHKIHWTAWCFHPKSSPRVLLDWEYTPTPFWGTYVKDALAGKQYDVKKLR